MYSKFIILQWEIFSEIFSLEKSLKSVSKGHAPAYIHYTDEMP